MRSGILKFITLTTALAFCNNILLADAEYAPTVKTFLLLHFNKKNINILGQKDKATATLLGDATIDKNGWVKGCLNPGKNGGVVIQTDRYYNPRYGHTTLEARVFLKEYPKNRAYILDKVYQSKLDKVHNNAPKAAAVGLSLFIDSKGRIGNEITSIYYGSKRKRLFYSPNDYKVPLNKWVHIAVVNAGWPVGKYIIYADGKPVLKKACGYHHKIFYSGEKENAYGKIIIGNNAKHDASFTGLIDEVRVLGAYMLITPPEDMSWTDPEAKKTLITGSPYFLPDTKAKIYVSFDEINKIDATEPAKWKTKFIEGKLLPGVRGKGYSSGKLNIKGNGIINGKEGTVEFWMMPENWNNRMTRNLGIFNSGRRPYLTLYIFNTVREIKPLSLFFKNDKKENKFSSVSTFFQEKSWYHIILTWKENRYKIYVNGKIGIDKKFKNINKMISSVKEYINLNRIPASKGENAGKSTRVDELYIYDKQLNDDEIHNAYYRYRDQSKLIKARPYNVSFKKYPSLDSVYGNLKFTEGNVPAKISLKLKQNGNTISSKELKKISKKAMIAGDMKNIKEGKFTAVLSLSGNDGKIIDIVKKEMFKKVYPWLHNKLGVPTKVPEPWMPLVKKGTNVKCLMTDYDFGSGLIKQLTTNSGEVLASPISFEGQVAGKKISFEPRTKITIVNKGLSAKVNQSANTQGLKITTEGDMDFDGFIKYKIELSPLGDSIKINNLKLIIPFKTDQDLDYYIAGEHMDYMANPVPARTGVFWNSLDGKMFKRHEVPEYGAMKKPRRGIIYGNFYPYAWVGNNHRGLCFMADNDKGWVQNEAKPAIEFKRSGNVVKLVLNLVAEAVEIKKGKPRTIILALAATPSKRPPKGWRHWKTSSFYTLEDAGRAKDTSIFYVPYPVDYKKSTAYMETLWQRGLIPLPYMDFYGSDGRMEPAEDFRWEWWPGITNKHFPRKTSIKRTNYYSGSIIDWYILNLNKWIDKSNVNGLYVDNHYPSAMSDTVFGPGYVHEKGKVQPGYQLFAMRELLKRIYCLLTQKGRKHPYLMVHMTHCMIAPTMSFVDIAYEGEDHYIHGEKKKQEREGADSITYWPNNVVRTIDMPHAYGVGVHWLSAVKGQENKWVLPHSRNYYIRAWYTQLLLHDMVGKVLNDKGARKIFEDFLGNDPKVEFVLYRDNNAISCTGKNIYISYYKRGNKVLAVVANHNKKQISAEVKINPSLLGFKNVILTDWETQKIIKNEQNILNISIMPRNYRLILINPK